ncbi:MAG: GGDEF and EAL domain-containing protein [Clostridia bacterium]|nr:GGDEF and EAL domain-containing protein [Clostridia bacterium]
MDNNAAFANSMSEYNLSKRYNMAIQNIYCSIFDVDLTNNTYFMSTCSEDCRPLAALSGNYDKAIENICEEFVYPGHKNFFCNALKRENVVSEFKKGEKNIYFECQIKNRTGEYCWFSIRMVQISDSASANVLGVVFIRNIDSQKKNLMEQDLKNRRYDIALRESYVGIFEINLSDATLFVIHYSHSNLQYSASYNYDYAFSAAEKKLFYSSDRSQYTKISLPFLKEAFMENGEEQIYTEFRMKLEDSYRWVSARAIKMPNHNDASILIFIRDIDEKKRKEYMQEQKEKQYDMALKESFDAIFLTSLATNEYAVVHYKIPEIELLPKRHSHDDTVKYICARFVHRDDRELFLRNMLLESIRDFLAKNEESYFEFRRKIRPNEYCWYSVMIRKTQDVFGNADSIFFFVKNIDYKKKAENLAIEYQMLKQQMEYQKQLYISNSRYKIIVKQTGASVFEWIRDDNSIYLSSRLPQYFRKAFTDRFGLTKILLSDCIHPDDKEKCKAFAKDAEESRSHMEITCRMKNDDGEFIWYKISVTNIFNDKGEKDRIIGTVIDVDEATKAYETLKYRAEYDSLTGAPNIQKFYSDGQRLLEDNLSKKYAIIRLDIEKFKIINDIYGRTEGDKALRFIAQTLQSFENEHTVFGRMNADIFCILTEYSDNKSIISFINKLSAAISSYPCDYKLRASFGVYKIDDINIPISTMCDWANLAIKSVRGNQLINYAFYDNTFRNQILEEKMIEDDMASALANGQFFICLQPKYNIQTSKIIGAEALVRWKHPKRGILAPSQFIPIFEKNSFIVKLDEYVWEEVCKLLRNWLDKGLKPIPVSVNVSRLHIHNPEFVNTIIGLSKKYKIPPNLIELEITENTFFDNIDKLFDALLALQKAGFIVAMDDFGSGYSSLNMLKSAPVDTIKIDREFFNETVTTEKGKIVVRCAISMAKQLDMNVIAEGVETVEQAKFLLESGCSVAQGYYYSKPLSVEDFEVNAFRRKEA